MTNRDKAYNEMIDALQDLLNYTGGWDVTDTEHPIYKARQALKFAQDHALDGR